MNSSLDTYRQSLTCFMMYLSIYPAVYPAICLCFRLLPEQIATNGVA